MTSFSISDFFPDEINAILPSFNHSTDDSRAPLNTLRVGTAGPSRFSITTSIDDSLAPFTRTSSASLLPFGDNAKSTTFQLFFCAPGLDLASTIVETRHINIQPSTSAHPETPFFPHMTSNRPRFSVHKFLIMCVMTSNTGQRALAHHHNLRSVKLTKRPIGLAFVGSYPKR